MKAPRKNGYPAFYWGAENHESCFWTLLTALRRLISQVRCQPALHFGQRHLLSGGVALHLVAGDHVDGEIPRLGVAEIQAADRGGRIHGKTFGEPDVGSLLHREQLP